MAKLGASCINEFDNILTSNHLSLQTFTFGLFNIELEMEERVIEIGVYNKCFIE